MNWFSVGGHASFFEGLGKSGVSVTCAGDIFARSAVFHGENTFSDHFSGVGAKNVNSNNFVCLFVS